SSSLRTILATVFLIFALPINKAGAETITVINNINHSQAKVRSMVKDEIYFVSISELAKAIDLSVWWDSIQKKVIIKDGEEILSLSVDQPEARSSTKTYKVNPSPHLVEGIVFVPIDFVVTILDSVFRMEVDWYETARILSLKPKVAILAQEESSTKKEETAQSIERAVNLSYINIPKDQGEVGESYIIPGSKRSIIIIGERHDLIQVQKNIGQILKGILAQYSRD
ncbi:MAG: copper amine oxidase N-terminal domain-containing protein, partial [bacterium]|nr:copper amine oxidase N-terminal domain-containing protein [bacterium]